MSRRVVSPMTAVRVMGRGPPQAGWLRVLLWACVLVIVLLGLYLAGAGTIGSIHVAGRAFSGRDLFGTRLTADPTLGLIYSLLAVLPWVGTAMIWRLLGRVEVARAYRLVACGGILTVVGFGLVASTMYLL